MSALTYRPPRRRAQCKDDLAAFGNATRTPPLHANVILAANFVLAMFILESQLTLCESLRAASPAGGIAAMNSIHRSILVRSLMTGAASLAFVVMAPAWVRAETVLVQGDDGANGMDGVPPDGAGQPGGDGESVNASAGSPSPNTAP
jgi:hypothetical protein